METTRPAQNALGPRIEYFWGNFIGPPAAISSLLDQARISRGLDWETSMNTESVRKYLPTEAAAAYLGLSKSTLEKQRITGSGPPFRKLGRRVLYAIGDLDTWA